MGRDRSDLARCAAAGESSADRRESAIGQSLFVDEASVHYGSDDVIRYTMVIVSPSGARNVTFEGMRCETGERRLYAFGRADGSWSRAKTVPGSVSKEPS